MGLGQSTCAIVPMTFRILGDSARDVLCECSDLMRRISCNDCRSVQTPLIFTSGLRIKHISLMYLYLLAFDYYLSVRLLISLISFGSTQSFSVFIAVHYVESFCLATSLIKTVCNHINRQNYYFLSDRGQSLIYIQEEVYKCMD